MISSTRPDHKYVFPQDQFFKKNYYDHDPKIPYVILKTGEKKPVSNHEATLNSSFGNSMCQNKLATNLWLYTKNIISS